MDDPPDSPHAYDDEFNSVSLDPKWNLYTPIDPVNHIHPYASVVGSARVSHNNYRQSWLMAQPVPNVVWGVFQAVTLPTNCFAWARMSFNTRFNAVSNNEADLALRFCADAGGFPDSLNCVHMNLNESDANTVLAKGGKAVAGVGTASATRNVGPQTVGTDSLIQDACYVGIQKLGTTYNFGLGWENGNWLWLTPQTSAATYVWLEVVFVNITSNAPGSLIMGCDFVRFKDGAELP